MKGDKHMMLFNNKPIDNKEYSEEILNQGLSIYEVCRVFRGKVIFLNDNILRLDNSIKKSSLDIDLKSLHVEDKLNRLIQLENIKEGNIKYVLRITPSGVDEYIYQINHSYPAEEAYQHGVDTVTCRAMRENAEVKYINSGLREMTNRILQEKGVYEVLLIDEDGCITEGSRSNVFFIRDNTLYTAPLPYVLPGTSRKRVLNICQEDKLNVIENRVNYKDIASYEAAFITGTSPLVLPIARIDGIAFDPHHPLLIKVMERYFNLLSKNF